MYAYIANGLRYHRRAPLYRHHNSATAAHAPLLPATPRSHRRGGADAADGNGDALLDAFMFFILCIYVLHLYNYS
jgi:hypothetical protein